MPLHRSRTKQYLDRCDFESLFIEELGWDKSNLAKLDLPIGTENIGVRSIAEKRGFTVFTYEVLELPDRSRSMKIDRQLTEYSRSHILIFSTQSKSEQVWMWVRQESGKPIAPRFERYRQGTSGESLIQKLDSLVIAFEEEEKTTLTTVTQKVKKAFDIEKVTKKFFQRFEKEHKAFLGFISGIEAEFDRTWYASLMLNRLMFVYFIQKKGFLDGNSDYLRDRLNKCQAEQGTDEFYSFYRIILLRLFHEGLGKSTRNEDLELLIGKVPYLNGGLFEVHQLEEKYTTIQISDDAFTKIFDFFDEYQWHLDDRPLRQDNEINPDVLGYIFEKYINQKQMGAYYTKEDITEYISKNTIIPFLFDAAARECAVAFQPDGAVWTLLTENPNRYIYEAVRKGVDTPLPAEIKAGIEAVAQRQSWNRPATAEYALPTETWREHIARRQRCLALRAKLANGEVTSINDLITHNLDIRQFAQDVIASCEGSDLLRAFYQAISQVSVLDPTCGSGAFLFAALNILEPLYTACLERMQGFVEDEDTVNTVKGKAKTSYEDFRHILAEMASHHNQRYFILKSIILNNLYGVDIMEEATEICKLRLFLKLVSQVEVQPNVDNFGLEPLPDIDFNIRSGNSLVGYVSLDEISKAIFSDEGGIGKTNKSNKKTTKGHQGNLFQFQQSGDVIRKARIVDTAFQDFRKMQTSSELKSEEFKQAKKNLWVKLEELNDELNYYLAREYGVDSDNRVAFDKWQNSHQPFHWFVEFYKIVSGGGFDVIIGNPPYVEYRVVHNNYQIKGYLSEDANNLYAFCMERSTKLLTQPAWFGMIVPTSVVGLDDTASLRSILLDKLSTTFCSTYSIRPSKLFEGVDQRLCIYIGKSEIAGASKILASKYYHWTSDERGILFSNLEYSASFVYQTLNRIAQTGHIYSTSILEKISGRNNKSISAYYSSNKLENIINYHRSPRYWIRSINFDSYFKSSSRSKSIHHVRNLSFLEEGHSKFIGALLNSSLFFFWFISLGNGRNITGSDVHNMPVGKISSKILKEISSIFDRLMKDYQDNSFTRIRQDCEFQEFRQNLSKPIIDEIDRVLAQHYGFTDEELDFIINYDIKYRMGRDSGGEE
jgi:Eco57I restriction-modification methylase